MPKSIMRYFHNPRGKKIHFEIRIKGGRALEQVAFVYLLSCKFMADIAVSERSFKDGEKRLFGVVELLFENIESAYDAVAHCSGHLDPDGCVNATYVGALPHADPDFRQSMALLEKLKSAQSN